MSMAVIMYAAGLVIMSVNLSASAVTIGWDEIQYYELSKDVDEAYTSDGSIGLLNTAL